MDDKHESIQIPHVPEHKPAVRGQCRSLGCLCFGITTMLGMSVTAGWTEASTANLVLGYGLVFGGGSQVVAGVLELIRGNSFGGTAFISFGAYWLGYFMFFAVLKTTVPLDGMAFYNGLWGLTAFAFMCLSLRKPFVLQLVFATLFITYVLLAVGVRNDSVNKAGGYTGLLCGFLAFYCGVADLAKDEYGVTLPGMFIWYKPDYLSE